MQSSISKYFSQQRIVARTVEAGATTGPVSLPAAAAATTSKRQKTTHNGQLQDALASGSSSSSSSSSGAAKQEIICIDSDDDVSFPVNNNTDPGGNSATGHVIALSEIQKSQFSNALRAVFDYTNESANNESSLEGAVGKLTPLEKQVQALKLEYPDCIMMVECGYRIRFFGEDARNAAQCLGIMCHKDHNFMVASIPTFRVLVHIRRLVGSGFKVALARQTETSALRKANQTVKAGDMFQRSVLGIFSPGVPIDDEDPAFLDLLGSKKVNGDEAKEDEDDLTFDDDIDIDNDASADTSAGHKVAAKLDEDDDGDAWIASISERHHETSLNQHASSASQHSILIIGVALLNVRSHCLSYDLVEGDPKRQNLLDLLDVIQPREIVMAESISSMTLMAIESRKLTGQSPSGQYICRVNKLQAETSGRERTVAVVLADEVLASCGQVPDEAELAAFTGLAIYLRRMNHLTALMDNEITHPDFGSAIRRIVRTGSASSFSHPASVAVSVVAKTSFQLDFVTAMDVRIFPRSRRLKDQSQTKSFASVYALLNHCKSSFGKRRLQSWLANPLLNIELIKQRQETVTWFMYTVQSRTKNLEWVSRMLSNLDSLNDIEKELTSLHNHKVLPRRLFHLLSWTANLAQLFSKDRYEQATTVGSRWPNSVVTILAEAGAEQLALLSSRFLFKLRTANDLSQLDADGVNIPFTDAALNDYPRVLQLQTALQQNAEGFQAELLHIRNILKQPSLAFKTLKIGPTSKLEYLIEVANNGTGKVPSNWIKVNSTKQYTRYHTPALLGLIDQVITLRDGLKVALSDAWMAFVKSVDATIHRSYRRIVSHLASLDVLHSLSKVAMFEGYILPTFHEGNEFDVKGARHPLAERVLQQTAGGPFVPNDIFIRCNFCNHSCQILTGPNAGGKTVYSLTVAIIAIMAQIGSYVPAESAQLCVFDNVFTRMGADDDLASGQSTFMIELARTSKILHTATARSLVILDELGRGTSTHDGVAIAMATLKHFIAKIGSAILFVTHYPQIADIISDAAIGDKAFNSHMSYLEAEGVSGKEIIFLYKLVEGAAEGSFGLNVGRLAGLDDDLLALAREKSQWMLQRIQMN